MRTLPLRSIHRCPALGIAATGACAAFAAAPASHASPFDPSVVAADAAWTIHLDVEAAVHSSLGRFILEEGPALGLDLDHLEQARAQLGVDPLDAVFGVTIYGNGEVGQDPVVIIAASRALEDVLDQHVDQLQAEGEAIVERVQIGDATGYLIDGEWFIAIGEGARPGTRRFVAAQGMDGLRNALRVIVGAAASRRGGARPGAASILFADADIELPEGVDAGGNAMAAQLLDAVQRVVVDMGQADGDMYLNLAASIADAKEAQSILQMTQGLIAMGRMMAEQQGGAEAEQLAELLNGLSLEVEGDALSLSLRYSAQKLIERARQELGGHEPD